MPGGRGRMRLLRAHPGVALWVSTRGRQPEKALHHPSGIRKSGSAQETLPCLLARSRTRLAAGSHRSQCPVAPLEDRQVPPDRRNRPRPAFLHHARQPRRRRARTLARGRAEAPERRREGQGADPRGLSGLVAAQLRKRRPSGPGPEGEPECPPRPGLCTGRGHGEGRIRRAGIAPRRAPHAASAPPGRRIPLRPRRPRFRQDHLLPLAGLACGGRDAPGPSHPRPERIPGNTAGRPARPVSPLVPAAGMGRPRGVPVRQGPLDPRPTGGQPLRLVGPHPSGRADRGGVPGATHGRALPFDPGRRGRTAAGAARCSSRGATSSPAWPTRCRTG